MLCLFKGFFSIFTSDQSCFSKYWRKRDLVFVPQTREASDLILKRQAFQQTHETHAMNESVGKFVLHLVATKITLQFTWFYIRCKTKALATNYSVDLDSDVIEKNIEFS